MKRHLLTLGFISLALAACSGLLLTACNNRPQAPAEKLPAAPNAAEKPPQDTAAAAKQDVADAQSEAAAPAPAAANQAADNTMQDKSGNNYRVVRIGNQLWTAENIKDQANVTCYANTNADSDFLNKYGCLYSWADAGKVCPADSGWRLPGRDDYNKMLASIGDSPKARCTAMCAAEFNNGTNSSGLNILPAGLYADGGYNRFGQVAMLWTAATNNEAANEAHYVLVDPGFMGAGLFAADKTTAYSVRCVKD